jgi:hypothetical protein
MKSPFLTAQLTSSLSGACAGGLDLGEFEGTVSVGGSKNGNQFHTPDEQNKHGAIRVQKANFSSKQSGFSTREKAKHPNCSANDLGCRGHSQTWKISRRTWPGGQGLTHRIIRLDEKVQH